MEVSPVSVRRTDLPVKLVAPTLPVPVNAKVKVMGAAESGSRVPIIRAPLQRKRFIVLPNSALRQRLIRFWGSEARNTPHVQIGMTPSRFDGPPQQERSRQACSHQTEGGGFRRGR